MGSRSHDISKPFRVDDGRKFRLKFFLHVSKREQKERFLKRLDDPEKNWKFSMGDVNERRHWGDYMDAYEDMIRNTATRYAPWYVVPSDRKWFGRLVVAAAIIDALESLELRFPELDARKREELKAARLLLEGDREEPHEEAVNHEEVP